MNQNNSQKGIIIALLISSFVIYASVDNIASAIRDSANNSNNGNLEYEISRFNDNFEKYLDLLKEKNRE